MTSARAQPGVVRRRVVVHGRVHGVGFRVGCARRARAAGLAGWVRNRADGTVEVAFEGSPEAVDAMVAWCRSGPTMARVTDVEVFTESLGDDVSFAIR
ncbi:MAG TPA: acylphosphatase [Acidimicrobiales bacterium]|nr:acylphosphatase [Acidimicrobiales bacterium]